VRSIAAPTDETERAMTTRTHAAEAVIKQFEGPWRDSTPVFGCCRKTIEAVVERVDLADVGARDVTARVQALQAAAEEVLPGHLEAHRCCAGHLADVAFDLPSLLAPCEPADPAE
jgi:hypothetical protein